MRKRIITSKTIFMLLIFMMTILIGNENVFAATTVTDFNGLKNAIETGTEDITVQGTINVTETLTVNRDVKISGGGITASELITTDPKSGNIFYVEDGKNFELVSITLDGDKKARIIYSNGGILKITDSTLQNGCPGANAKANPGGGIFLRGGSLEATGTNFIGNTPGTNDTLKQGDGDKNGGAIYVGSVSTDITIEGGSFVGNTVPAYGHGAAIYQNAGKLNINTDTTKNNETKFTENTGHKSLGDAGTQGVCIHTREEVTADINNVEATIIPGFNTGGFLRSLGGTLSIKNSNFTIDSNKGEIGIAGGVISSQNSNLTIEKSKFKAGDGSRVNEAGGLIEIVGTGKFNLTGSTLEGAGASWNAGKYTANTGGAISFYDDSTVTANITDTKIQNFMVDGNGAGIALSKGNGHSSSVNLTLKNTTIQNAAAYTWNANSYGGCMYIGEGNTVKIDGGTISGQTTSNIAAGIYNMGDLEITGGAQITGNTGYQMVGGIYHGGSRLKIDEATISGNQKGDNKTGHNHYIDGKEKSGINIYADKDVIITPNAIFDDNDVRVFDGQSSILLTGKLTNKINVSISEDKKTTNSTNANIKVFEEGQHRKVGYVVAKGEGYEPTAEDAKKLHYVTNDASQAVAGPDDHEGVGAWDFVLNPKTKNIVLGQRVKVTLHANGTDAVKAKFEGVTEKRNEDEGILTKPIGDDKKQDIYDIYTAGEKLAELIPKPNRKNYSFTGWYKENIVSDDTPDVNKDGKTLVENLKLVKDANEITKIIDPHEYNLYAGWEKIIPVEKVWDDNDNEFGNRPDSVTVKLFLNGNDLNNSITLSKDNDWKGEFKNLPESEVDIIQYDVKEVPEQIPGYKKGEVTGNDIDGFVVTNSTEYTTVEGKKTWVHGDNPKDKQPTEVTVILSDGKNETSKTVSENDNWTWKFENLPKYKNKTLVTYTLTEKNVDSNYTSTKSIDGYSFTNTFTNKFKVTYEFKSGTEGKTLPDVIKEQFLPEPETGKENGAKVTPSNPKGTTYEDTENEGTWTFQSWEPAEQTIEGKDVKFVGTWEFTEKTSDFTITKTVDKKTYEKAGDELTYTVTVTNTGEKDLTGLTISDDKTTFENPTFDLSLKEKTKTFTYTYKVTDADVTAKKVENTASLTDGKTTKTSSTTSTLVEKNAAFTITKTVDKKTYEKAGDVLTYTVVITNTGEKDLTGLTISDDKTTFENPTFDLSLKEKTKTFTYTYTVTENDVIAKKVENTASLTDGKTTKTSSTTSTLVEKNAAFTITKTVDKKTYEKAGDVLTYTVVVTNTGQKKLEKLTISDTKVKLNIEPFDLEVGASRKFTYEYTVKDSDVEAKEIKNTATVKLGDKEDSATAISELKENKPEPQPTPEPTPQPPIIPEKPEFNPFWPIYFGSDEKHVVSEKTALNKEDHKAYMFGYPNWNFLPNSNMTRAEVTAMFARLLKNYPSTDVKYNLPYSDVFESDWYYPAVGFMTENNIIKGYEDGTFRPNAPITRAEFATIASKFEELVGNGVNGFKDVPATHWALKYINSAYARGWVTGYEDGTFRPDRYITRAEVVTVTNKMLIRYADVDFVRANKDIMLHFKDLDESHWAYFNIMEATHGHDFTRKANMLDEIWHRLNGEAFIFPDLKYYDK